MSNFQPVFYPSILGGYVALGSCDRYAYFAYRRAAADPSGTHSKRDEIGLEKERVEIGRETEERVGKSLEDKGYTQLEACDSLEETIRIAKQHRTPCFFTEVPLSGTLEADSPNPKSVLLRGRIDLLVHEPERGFTVVECKSTEIAHPAALLQVSLYHAFLSGCVSEGHVEAKVVSRKGTYEGSPALSSIQLRMALADALSVGTRIAETNRDVEPPGAEFRARCDVCPRAEECFEEARSRFDAHGPAFAGLSVAEQRSEEKRFGKNALQKMVAFRKEYYDPAAFSVKEEEEVRPMRKAFLPWHRSMAQIFIEAVKDSDGDRIAWLGVLMGNPKEGTFVRRSWSIRRDEEEREALAELAGVLREEDFWKKAEDGGFRFHVYFWADATYALLMERLYAVAGEPEVLRRLRVVANALAEEDTKEDDVHAPARRRVTRLEERMRNRTRTACLGTSLLEISFLRWEEKGGKNPWEEAPELCAALLGKKAPPENVRDLLKQRPRFADRLSRSVVEKLKTDPVFAQAFEKTWLNAMVRVEVALRCRTDCEEPQVHGENPFAIDLPESGSPLLSAAARYVRGSHDHTRRTWFARYTGDIENLIAKKKAFKLDKLVWGDLCENNERSRLTMQTDARIGHLFEDDDADHEESLVCPFRMVPVDEKASALSSEAIVNEGIALTSVAIESRGQKVDDPWRLSATPKKNPSQDKDRAGENDVRRRIVDWSAVQKGDPTTDSKGRTVSGMLLFRDVPRDEERIREALEEMESSGESGGALGWDFLRKEPARESLLSDALDALAAKFLSLYGLRKDGPDASMEPHRREGRDEAFKVIRNVLGKKLGVIQGPPGTGKTEVSALAILLHASLQGAREPEASPHILVTAVTHEAVSNVLLRCAKILSDVRAAWKEASGREMPSVRIEKWLGSKPKEKHRIGSKKAAAPQAPGSETVELLDVRMEKAANGKTIYKILSSDGEKEKGLREEPFGQAIVLVGTVTAQLPNLIDDRDRLRETFGLLVFDEASQTKLYHALLAFPFLDKAGQMLIVGDGRQLGPIEFGRASSDRRALIREQRPFRSLYKFASDTAFLKGEEVFRLRYTFRLPEDLWRLLSVIYVKDGIPFEGRRRGGEAHDRMQEGLRGVLQGEWEGIGLITYRCEEAEKSIAANAVEYAILGELMAGLEEKARKKVRILSPFRKQNALLRTLAPGAKSAVKRKKTRKKDTEETENKKEEVSTVDAMQGSEEETILYSATGTRQHLKYLEAFLLDAKRATVAFSRAKKRLVIVVSRDLLDHVPSTPEAMEQMELWKYLRFFADRDGVAKKRFQVNVPCDEKLGRMFGGKLPSQVEASFQRIVIPEGEWAQVVSSVRSAGEVPDGPVYPRAIEIR